VYSVELSETIGRCIQAGYGEDSLCRKILTAMAKVDQNLMCHATDGDYHDLFEAVLLEIKQHLDQTVF
jgi:hypothetical protein